MQPESQEKAPVPLTKRRFGINPILDGYILREFMIPFSLLILAFVILFIIGDIFNDLEDFLSNKSSLRTIFTFFMLKLPGNVRFILPITVLLACMYTMANFGKNMEITAMRSSGVSLMRCGGSIFVVGLLVTGLLFVLNEKVVPYSEREALIMQTIASKGKERVEEMYKMLSYRSTDKRRTWLFEYFKQNGEHQNVILKLYREDGMLNSDLRAQSASFSNDGWIFKDVTVTEYSKDGLMPKNPVHHDELKIPLSQIPENPEQIINASKPPEDLPSLSIIALLRDTEHMGTRCRNIYLSTLFYRLAFPWSCFLAVFLGVPLATKNERSGIFMAIISAVVVIVAYQLSTHIFLILGKQGVLNPIIAGFTPSLAFIIYGWVNVVKRV